MLLVKVYYFLSSGSAVFLLPYLYPFFQSKGFTDAQLGIVAVLRPWLSAVAGLLLPLLADRLQCHRVLMLSTFGASIVLRLGMFYAASNFLALISVLLVCEFLAAPVGVLADAIVVAASEKAGGYGRQRLWASVGWGGLSYPSGVLLDKCGFGAGFVVFGALSLPCFVALMRFPCTSGDMAGKENDSRRKALGCENAAEDAVAIAREQEEKAQGLGKRSSPVGLEGPTPFALPAVQVPLDCHDTDVSTLMLPSDQGTDAVVDGATERTSACCGSAQLVGINTSPGLGRATLSASASILTQTAEQGTAGPVDEGEGGAERNECRRRLLALTSVFSAEPFFPGASKCSTPTERPVYQLHAECAEVAIPVDNNVSPSGASLRRRSNSSTTLTGEGACAGRRKRSISTGSGPQAPPPKSFARDALQLLSNGNVWLFLAKAFLLGFGTGTMGTWLLIYMGSLGAPHALQGLMLTVNCVAEVPMFHFQDAITSRFPTNAILHVSIGTMVVRLAAYALLPGLPGVPWVVLPVELLHGITFALCWGASCVHCKHLAPGGLQATMQGLMQSVFNGVGGGLGGLVGAILHEHLGGRLMFLATAAIVGAGWVLLTAAEFLQLLLADRRHRPRW
ncbi:hypothetical protein PLESTM_001258000 [Pleodorina starrii]|nr:hypothetical protein PLESTM_001258000 [Pleodorina starrii]